MVKYLLGDVVDNILGITLLTDQVVAGHYLQTPFKCQRTFIPSKQQIFELLLGNQSIGNEKISQRPLRKITPMWKMKILSYLDIMAIPVMEFQVRWYKISFDEFQKLLILLGDSNFFFYLESTAISSIPKITASSSWGAKKRMIAMRLCLYSKLYIPSTLNNDYLLWHTVQCAVKC